MIQNQPTSFWQDRTVRRIILGMLTTLLAAVTFGVGLLFLMHQKYSIPSDHVDHRLCILFEENTFLSLAVVAAPLLWAAHYLGPRAD